VRIYTYSEARQRLAEVLKEADEKGKVYIKRRNGRTYVLMPEKIPSSPLDVPTVKANISTDEIVVLIQEMKKRAE